MPGGQAAFARVGGLGGWHTVVPRQTMWILLQPKKEGRGGVYHNLWFKTSELSSLD